MAEFVPIPLALLVRRALLEYEREGKIFDLPKNKFFRGLPGLDLSVLFHGDRAATPLGPAAGPHTQLAQNIALCWLAGSRIIELKTVQILDELKIPRPCIDAANVGYNVEWSQELRLEQSLREYVTAAMLVEILRHAKIPGENVPAETVFDMSVGYSLEGIRSPRVRAWIAGMKNAAPIIDSLRAGLPAPHRDLPFTTAISKSASLSTFHGCPADEIESIVAFLLTDMDCHVCLKLNPTLLGRAEVEHLLYEALGYREIQIHPQAFENDLHWDDALDLIPRLSRLARKHGKHFSVKFSNTLVVKNHKHIFQDELMYLSGAPLHVLAMELARKFRHAIPEQIPMSFSGGVDARNVAFTVAQGFVPVTTCTDLLRPGGYARLARYFENLGSEMHAAGATNIDDFVRNYRGTDKVERYRRKHNQAVPRKVGAKLWLYDCINCDKCLPVCPNDANFVYEVAPQTTAYDNFELASGGIRRIPGGLLRVMKAHQLANYADACNDCGNCDVFCPEDGGPNREKPRFFGSLESYRNCAGENSFFVDWQAGSICGVIGGKKYALTLGGKTARYETESVEVEIRVSDRQPLRWRPLTPGGLLPGEWITLEILPYLKLKLLLESAGGPRHVHFANIAGLEEGVHDHAVTR